MRDDEVHGRLIEKMSRELGSDVLAFLGDKDVTEIMLNDDGRVWICRMSVSGAIDTGITVPPSRSISFLGTVASFYGKTVHHANTMVSEVLPIDGSRLIGVIPPTVAEPSFNIRKKATRIFTLEEYIQQGRMTAGDREAIRDGIAKRKNFLVAGATGSGKTTLTNAVLYEINEINPTHRVVSMEDTAELQIHQRNKVSMYTDENVSMQRLLFIAMRQNPDRIIIGEVRDGTALDLLKSWNTGHPGGVTTLHANGSLEALSRLEMLILEAVPNPMQRLIGQALGLVLFIERLESGPTLTEIMEVKGYDTSKEEYDVQWIKRREKIDAP
ncbi:MAG: P-type conjugative transfer ATPase TrbB [Synergistaceae bacterium]|jgi:type IV secretion system protein VirB11|nr:P-type conjugative transfer ATPase TrbB [Synergistaceae bacterium]